VVCGQRNASRITKKVFDKGSRYKLEISVIVSAGDTILALTVGLPVDASYDSFFEPISFYWEVFVHKFPTHLDRVFSYIRRVTVLA
jgi:hypothetical protein